MNKFIYFEPNKNNNSNEGRFQKSLKLCEFKTNFY